MPDDITITLESNKANERYPYLINSDDMEYGLWLTPEQFVSLKSQINALPEIPRCDFCLRYSQHAKKCTRDREYALCDRCEKETNVPNQPRKTVYCKECFKTFFVVGAKK